MTPVYLLRDPELFKQIAIKDFDSFEDHKFVLDPEADSLIGNTVFMMCGQKWRDMRTTLSPAFTGCKMRLMFELVRECAVASTEYFNNETMQTREHVVEIKEFYARYTNDVIASCAFGLKINSLDDRHNTFFETGSRLQNLGSPKSFLNIVCQRVLPWIMRPLGIEFISAEVRRVFSSLVLQNMAERQQLGISRPDLIDILMKVRRDQSTAVDATANGVKRQWRDIELISQCFVFFLAGFDTSTWLLVSTTYELALNADIQDKLMDEVDRMTKTLNGREITYEDMKTMKYLDMVVNEVLRIRPPAAFIDRVCTKDYTLSDGYSVNVEIKKGSLFWIPLYCFHHNPNYFPDPERFDPERFSDENRAQMNSAHYIPFGSGPRTCIGMRFALMEVKAILYFLLKQFRFEVAPNTEIPMTLVSSPFGIQPRNGLNVKVVSRKHT